MSVKYITKLALLLAITLALQMLGFPQPITGPAVNGMLIISTLLVGPAGGAFIGLLTPVIALIRGILPPPLGPAVPFIILGNWAYIFAFAGLKRVNRYLAIVVGAIVKFLILAAAVRLFLALPGPVAQALQAPQLITALSGGIIALLVRDGLQKTGWSKD